MSDRWAARIAWPLSFLGVAMAAAVSTLDVLDRSRIHSFDGAQPIAIVLSLSFSSLGAVIVFKQHGNRIGWLFLLIGVLTPLPSLAGLYYIRSALAGGLPGARWAAWVDAWSVFLVYPAGLSLIVFLVFPSGRLPSRRWRP